MCENNEHSYATKECPNCKICPVKKAQVKKKKIISIIIKSD